MAKKQNMDISEEISRLKKEIEDLRKQLKQQKSKVEDDEEDEEEDDGADSNKGCERDEDFGMSSYGTVSLSHNSINAFGSCISVINGRVYGSGIINGQVYGDDGGKTIKASGTIIEKSYDVPQPFTRIENLSPFNVLLFQKEECGVSVRGSKNIVEKHLSIKVSKGTLYIDVKKPVTVTGLIGKRVPKITICAPNILGITMSGSGNFKAKTNITVSKFSAEVSGSGNAWFQDIDSENDFSVSVRGTSDVQIGNVKCNEANATVTGSGELKTEGIIANGNSQVTLAGSGDSTCRKLQCNNLLVKITGSGNFSAKSVTCQSVKVGVSGSGDVRLAGKARHADFGIRGSGEIQASSLRVDEANAVSAGSGSIVCCADKHFDKQCSGSSDIRNVGRAQDKQSDFWDDF